MRKYVLEVAFDDGTVKAVNVGPYLFGEVFEPLKREKTFRAVKVDRELGVVVWPNGADFCADFLYKLGEKKAEQRHKTA